MDTSRESDQPGGEHEARNFRLALINGIFARVGFRLVDSNMVLSAFVKELTNSNVLVGLTCSTMRAGWMWPQLIISNLLEHRERKMPFYIFGVTVRVAAWLLILLLTILIGDHDYFLLFICFYVLYFIASSSLGISTIPFNDIVAKSIPVKRRARLFSLRQLTSGFFSIGVGFLIRFVLSEGFYFPFPHNYATLFGLSALMMAIASIVFILSREPIHSVHDKRRPFWRHLKRGPYFLKNDRDYRYFLIFRIASTFSSMCIPFYVPYALDHLGIVESTIGSFTAVAAASAVLSNALWVYIGEKHGSKSLMIVTHSLSCLAPMIAAFVRYLPAAHQVTCYFLVFALTQAFINGSTIAYMTYSLNLAPSMSRPTYLGFLNTLMFPMSFVPLLAGVLIKIISYEWMFILSACIAVVTVYFAINLSNVDNRDDIESKEE